MGMRGNQSRLEADQGRDTEGAVKQKEAENTRKKRRQKRDKRREGGEGGGKGGGVKFRGGGAGRVWAHRVGRGAKPREASPDGAPTQTGVGW